MWTHVTEGEEIRVAKDIQQYFFALNYKYREKHISKNKCIIPESLSALVWSHHENAYTLFCWVFQIHSGTNTLNDIL